MGTGSFFWGGVAAVCVGLVLTCTLYLFFYTSPLLYTTSIFYIPYKG